MPFFFLFGRSSSIRSGGIFLSLYYSSFLFFFWSMLVVPTGIFSYCAAFPESRRKCMTQKEKKKKGAEERRRLVPIARSSDHQDCVWTAGCLTVNDQQLSIERDGSLLTKHESAPALLFKINVDVDSSPQILLKMIFFTFIL